MHFSLQKTNQSQELCFTNFRESNFKEIICKLRQYLNMIFLNLAQDPMGIISGLLTRGCKHHFKC